MYRVALEAILGFTKRGDTLVLNPHVPRAWAEYAIDYRFGTATYRSTVLAPDGSGERHAHDPRRPRPARRGAAARG